MPRKAVARALALPRITTATVVKLVVASLCVGLVLAWLDKDPIDLLYWARGVITNLLYWTSGVISNLLGNATSSVKYVLLGAVIVVPIWLIHYLWRAARGKP